jgi:hypothetical protein
VLDAEHREAMQTFVGLYEILTNELGQSHKKDFERFVRTEEEIVKIKLARLEEKINALRVLVGALGAALLGVGGSLAVLAG